MSRLISICVDNAALCQRVIAISWSEFQQQGRATSGDGLLLDDQQNGGRELYRTAKTEPSGQRDIARRLRRQIAQIEDNHSEASAVEQQIGGAQNLFQTLLG